jgi:methionine-rich copper-binding protein CopC
VTRSSLTRPLAAGLLIIGALGAVLFQAAPATAHSELLETSPASGAVLDAVPRDIQLTFGEEVQSQGSGIVVKGPSGQRYDDATTFTVDRNVASVELQPDDASYVDGQYTVSYRVVSADGHIVSGSYGFRLKGVGPSGQPTPALTSTLDASPAAGTSESEDSGSGVVWVLGLGAIGIVLVAAVISVAVRGRRGR